MRRESGPAMRRPRSVCAFQQLRDDERGTVLGADVVDREDVGMVEAARRLGFLLEAQQPIGIVRERRRQDLDRDVAPELVVSGAVDLSHAASARTG